MLLLVQYILSLRVYNEEIGKKFDDKFEFDGLCSRVLKQSVECIV